VAEVCDEFGGLQEFRTGVWSGNLKGIKHFKELSVAGRVILSGI
jgi:hypothetical protein